MRHYVSAAKPYIGSPTKSMRETLPPALFPDQWMPIEQIRSCTEETSGKALV